MMHTMYLLIGTHTLFVSTVDEEVADWIRQQFLVVVPEDLGDVQPDLYIRISKGYGKPVEDIQVAIQKERDRIIYRREDFLLETDEWYHRALLQVHDDLSLNHALMTLYSAYIVRHGWGMMLHSSCAVERNRAYLFAGQSGAGKSTVVALSEPRKILSDEAALLKIEADGVYVYDSPFRSDSMPTFDREPLPLAGIHLLKQSQEIRRERVKSSEAVFQLMDKIFYWAADPGETVKLLALCGKLVSHVPVYDLMFQKNNLFWERIS